MYDFYYFKFDFAHNCSPGGKHLSSSKSKSKGEVDSDKDKDKTTTFHFVIVFIIIPRGTACFTIAKRAHIVFAVFIHINALVASTAENGKLYPPIFSL